MTLRQACQQRKLKLAEPGLLAQKAHMLACRGQRRRAFPVEQLMAHALTLIVRE
ncbi:hypothetical protein D3C80_2113240 [compost metagenome]